MKIPMATDQVEIPAGVIALTSYGVITLDTTHSLLEMRGYAERIGLRNVTWMPIHGNLVDKARNDAVIQFLKSDAQWLWFLDGDMKFQPNLIEIMLRTAYQYEATKDFDIIGGYCNLRGGNYLPTIDTGTGTWEPHDAGLGPKEVIRTGGACLLAKRHVFERMRYPWFGVRPAPRPIEMLMEVDNYARCKFDGRNPFQQLEAWGQIVRCAAEDAARGHATEDAGRDWAGHSSVGEDSNFADKARALGFRIVVQTNAVCEHVETRAIGPKDHTKATRELLKRQRYYAGAL